MKRHTISSLILALSLSLLSACAAEEQAVQKAAVDVKAAATTKTAAITRPAAAQPAAANKPAAANPPAAAQATPGAKPAAAGQQGQQASVDPPPALAVPPGYSYQPRGRRDPFVNPVPKTETVDEDSPKPLARPDGLPGVLVSEVKLSGIIYSPAATMKKAMLVVGRSTYFAKQGDSLFDGVIKEIRPNEVVFALVSTKTRQPVNRETVIRTGGSSVPLAGEK